MAKRDGDRVGARVIALGALRCSNAACTALPRNAYFRSSEVTGTPSGFTIAFSRSLDPTIKPQPTELDFTIADRQDGSLRRRCNVCSALDALAMLCERGEITGDDARRMHDEMTPAERRGRYFGRSILNDSEDQ